MKWLARVAVELLGLFLLGAVMLLVAIVSARKIADEKMSYFLIGYYVAIHHDLVLWLWRKLGIEKANPA